MTTPATAVGVGALALASAMGIGRFAFTPMLPLMQQEGLVDLAQGGALAAANYAGYLLGALACAARPPAPVRAVRWGLVAVALLTGAMGLAQGLVAWALLRFGAGVASAVVLVGATAWALPRLAADAPRAARLYSGVGLGIALAGLLTLAAAALPTAGGWALLGAVSAAVALACWPRLGDDGPRAVPPVPAPVAAEPAWPLVLAYGAFGFGYILPATFLPAAARAVLPQPALFGWVWPVFGLAAAASTVAVQRLAPRATPRRRWAVSQAVMGLGVAAAALSSHPVALLCCALAVGGTFMVVTMAGLQEARRVGGPRLIAALTAAFALGQLIGPFSVGLLARWGGPGLALPGLLATAVLWLGLWPLRRRATSLNR